MITGSLEHFSNRKELQAKIEELGGKVTGSVTAKTSYLINNDVTSSSSKNKKARELGIEIQMCIRDRSEAGENVRDGKSGRIINDGDNERKGFLF